MKNKALVIFENGVQKRFKPCGCDRGKIKKINERLSDMYSVKELMDMNENPNQILDSKYICEECEEELEQI